MKCADHQGDDEKLPYLRWHEKVDDSDAKGLRQAQCIRVRGDAVLTSANRYARISDDNSKTIFVNRVDEIVIDDWLQVEHLGQRCWSVTICGVVFTVDEKGGKILPQDAIVVECIRGEKSK